MEDDQRGKGSGAFASQSSTRRCPHANHMPNFGTHAQDFVSEAEEGPPGLLFCLLPIPEWNAGLRDQSVSADRAVTVKDPSARLELV